MSKRPRLIVLDRSIEGLRAFIETLGLLVMSEVNLFQELGPQGRLLYLLLRTLG